MQHMTNVSTAVGHFHVPPLLVQDLLPVSHAEFAPCEPTRPYPGGHAPPPELLLEELELLLELLLWFVSPPELLELLLWFVSPPELLELLLEELELLLEELELLLEELELLLELLELLLEELELLLELLEELELLLEELELLLELLELLLELLLHAEEEYIQLHKSLLK